MTLTVTCQQCGQRFAVAPHLYGKRVNCLNCQAVLDIPNPAAATPIGRPDVLAEYSPPASGPAVRPRSMAADRVSSSPSERRFIVLCAAIGGGAIALLFLAIVVSWLFKPSSPVPDSAEGSAQAQPAPPAVKPMAAAERQPEGISLAEARRSFQTKLRVRESAGVPIPEPPAAAARLVQYESAVGKLSAYVTLPPSAGQRHPAIIWISGGDCNTIDDGFFQPAPPDNDQTASAFRQAGVVTMYPSLRGGNSNPGFKESFFGEVDDVLAALDYLGKQEFVDRGRIYLGGHSTGGTLVLLVAESTNRFRAVFSFGPTDDIRGYGPENLPFDLANPKELELRNPLKWLPAVGCPLFVFEGTDEPSNISALVPIQRASQIPLVHVQAVKGANHFSILAPLTRLIAAKIVADTGPTTTVSFSDAECNSLFGR